MIITLNELNKGRVAVYASEILSLSEVYEEDALMTAVCLNHQQGAVTITCTDSFDSILKEWKEGLGLAEKPVSKKKKVAKKVAKKAKGKKK